MPGGTGPIGHPSTSPVSLLLPWNAPAVRVGDHDTGEFPAWLTGAILSWKSSMTVVSKSHDGHGLPHDRGDTQVVSALHSTSPPGLLSAQAYRPANCPAPSPAPSARADAHPLAGSLQLDPRRGAGTAHSCATPTSAPVRAPGTRPAACPAAGPSCPVTPVPGRAFETDPAPGRPRRPLPPPRAPCG